MTERDLEPLPDTAIEMFFGAVAGGVSGEMLGAVAGAGTPLAIRVTQAGWRRIHDVRDVALREGHLSLDEIAKWAEESERNADFLVRLLDAARRASLEEKRIALGRVAARAMTDDAALDESLLFLDAIDAMDAPHIRVLATMAGPRPGEGQLEGHSVTGVIDLGELSEKVPDSAAALRSVLSALESRGAVTDSAPATWDQVEGKERWIVSDFGHALLELLVAEG